MGTKQLVVHDALDTTTCLRLELVVVHPTTKVASASFEGAEMITARAPPSRWPAASPR